MRSLGLRTNVYVGKTGLCARGDLWTPRHRRRPTGSVSANHY